MKNIKGDIIIYTDTHWRFPFPSISSLDFGPNVFYIGDNIELVNFDPKYTEETLAWARAFFRKCIETNTNMGKGNHEGGLYKYLSEMIEIEIPMEIVFLWNDQLTVACHGLHTWKPKRVQKWFDKPLKPDTLFGSRFLKKLFSKTLAKGRRIWKKTKLSKKQVKRTNAYMMFMQPEPKTLIMGHIHPTKHIDETHDGKRMICCMQGRTVLKG